MAGIRFHYTNNLPRAAGGSWGGRLLKGLGSLLVGAILLLILLASATVILVALGAGIIAFLGWGIRRLFRGGGIPASPRPAGKQGRIREAHPSCPHCGRRLDAGPAGDAGAILRCPSCGEPVPESDVVYTSDSR